jgi:pyruvate ferredoxin oxidoreductase alpha subunit
MAQGVAVLGGTAYSYFKYEMHLASMKALEVYKEISLEYEKVFGRKQDIMEGYMLDDAEYVLLMTNSFSTFGKAAVKNIRAKGVKAGLLKLRLVRPLPEVDIKAALRGRKAIAVIDQNISIGKGGILHSEIASCLCNKNQNPLLLSFISGLGGKNISQKEFEFIFDCMIKAFDTGEVTTHNLLYTEADWHDTERLKRIAGRK